VVAVVDGDFDGSFFGGFAGGAVVENAVLFAVA